VKELQDKFTVSQRRACRVIDQPRQSQRYQPKVRDDEPALVKDILELVREFPRYGYRMICGKLRQLGWTVNPKRVYRIWKQEGLKVPVKKRKKRRLGSSNNSVKRRSAQHVNHVWSWDFIFDRTIFGKQLKWLTIVDEFTRENLCLDVGYGFKSEEVIDRLATLTALRGLPKFIRSDNGPEFIAGPLREWLGELDVGTLYIEPGSPWENAFAESFNSRFRDEFLAVEVFDNLPAAKRLTAAWRVNYNDHRPHSSLGYMTPSDFARQCSASSGVFKKWNGPRAIAPRRLARRSETSTLRRY
jgi:transposase InsO family protein